MYIYKITNKVNGKVYIGQSIRPIEQRFQRHINDAVNNILDTHFARAIRKYGKENFYIELVETCDNQTELNLREQYWIRKYDSINNGYNETDATSKCGGNTYMSKTESEMKEISEKISKTKFGSRIGKYLFSYLIPLYIKKYKASRVNYKIKKENILC